jgi:pyrimidine oxygenase
MEIGVFIPIGNNGWLISENAPQYMPSFDLNKEIVLKAEKYGFDFALSMIKLRGFGGKTQFWEHNLESFTLMAGLAAITERIKVFATVATLTIPPAICARMASTIDSISHGRFGVNLVTGWQKAEYDQMGLWPGQEHYIKRYDMLAEYAQILRDLWDDGVSNFQGEYFQMTDCRVSPKPAAPVKLICAGSSDEGLAFSARYADYAFCLGVGVNTPTAFAFNNQRLKAATDKTGRKVEVFVLMMVITAETDSDAEAKWQSYRDGVDLEAVSWLKTQSAPNAVSKTTNVVQLSDTVSAVNINMGTLVGSYGKIAAMLDEIATVEGTAGVLLTFDDFVAGVEIFGKFIQPLMKTRQHVSQR